MQIFLIRFSYKGNWYEERIVAASPSDARLLIHARFPGAFIAALETVHE